MPDALLISPCAQLLTLRGPVPRRGRALRELGIIRNGAVLIQGERIVAVGPQRRIGRLPAARRARRMDASGCVVLPGFVDSHTHLVYPTSRAEEYEMRLAGRSYEEIARAGGGILASVARLRRMPAAELEARAHHHLAQFAEHGTTTLEAKSGYGLDLASELKILELIARLDQQGPLELVPTFLGAHVVPREFRRRPAAYVDQLVRRMIPAVASRGLAEFCDVFCDRGAFTPEQARRILTAGRVCGLEPRLHAEQLARTGATRLAVKLRAASADHLECASRGDIRALAESDVVATLLPGTILGLGLDQLPPARALIEAGAIVAVATDFNPGTSPTPNMQMILTLACALLRMTPAEAIAAATINAAYSLRRAERIGSLEPGKQADVIALALPDYHEIPYYFGVSHCKLTIKRGRIIYNRLAPR